MIQFYKRVALSLLLGIALILLVSWLCISRFYASSHIFPADERGLSWVIDTLTDHHNGGTSSVRVNPREDMLEYDFYLTDDVKFPYASLAINFEHEDAYGGLVDLSKYTTIRFEVACEPSNVLSFVLYAYDDSVPDLSTSGSYRIPTRYFACSGQWSAIEIQLHDLELPEWWLRMSGLSLSEQGYDLGRVSSFAFANSLQSPLQTDAKVQIRQLSLHGYDYRFLYILGGFVLLLLLGGLILLLRGYRRAVAEDVRMNILRERPFLSYQKLTIGSRKDAEVEKLLKFFAQEYSNPELKLDGVASSVGINRTKINEMLNAELGLSFSSYVNKLRLTEAARLLSDSDSHASITEICHKVGYNSVSYFSALFKKEYGCSPKAFRSLVNAEQNQSGV